MLAGDRKGKQGGGVAWVVTTASAKLILAWWLFSLVFWNVAVKKPTGFF
jgi:hypothetical protein